MHEQAREVLALAEPGTLEKIALDVGVGGVEPWDWIEVGGRPERVQSVTALFGGRRIHFIHGGSVTLPNGRMVRVTRTVRRGEISRTVADIPPPGTPESRSS
ncbi:hypothetical protein HUT13_01070 [Streptomyces harbinensis]|uniref:hypothetical protein n=1 Tax=Streptomyces harbinensis TaxID=1176198 RepID=UPI00158FF093|nr:hypothetical protein [Streptomyces harbinensis]QKV67513.1 hypothetical protein HUT13_01070 [Streptomyces harbinensis]